VTCVVGFEWGGDSGTEVPPPRWDRSVERAALSPYLYARLHSPLNETLMLISHGLDGLRSLPPGSVLSIGNYDGIHRGHQALLGVGRELRSQTPGAMLAVATFEPHPLTVLRPELAPPRLSTPMTKQALLEPESVDHLIILPPTRQVLDLTAEDFWKLLRDEARPAHLVEGDTFNFGKARVGTIDKLREWAAGSPVRLHVVPPVTVPLLDLQVVPVSSSLVRWLLEHGRVRDAAICLGRAYAMEGPVVRGFQRGQQLGFPTANIQVTEQIVPLDGVYAGRCTVNGTTYPAAVSIGRLPTFGPDQPRQIEAHLIGFSGDLYDRPLTVELIDWLREQRKFASLDALRIQLADDVRLTTRLASSDPSRPIVAVSGN
jgi:riboflavin kinase/FMN adenylyltransferase